MGERRFGEAGTRFLLPAVILLFVGTWPLEKRRVFLTGESFVTGAYTDAATVSLYASDIAFLVLVAAWTLWKLVGNSTLRGGSSPRLPAPVLWSGLLLATWSVLRTLPIGDGLAWYNTGRIVQGLCIAFIVADVWRRERFRKIILWSLVAAGILQSSLAISQVITGENLGLQFLGEPNISTRSPGVAKVDVSREVVPAGTTFTIRNQGAVPTGTISSFPDVAGSPENVVKVLRGYGTFPHPNILGAFLVCSIASLIAAHSRNSRSSYRNNDTLMELKMHWFLRELLFFLAASTLLSALLGTYSRSAYLLLVSVLVAIFLVSRMRLDRGTLVFFYAAFVIASASYVLDTKHLLAFRNRILPPSSDKFLQERIIHATDALRTLGGGGWLIGVGPGRGVPAVVRAVSDSRPPWAYQYPHHVPLVVLLELGGIGLGLFLVVLWSACKGSLRYFVRVAGSPAPGSSRVLRPVRAVLILFVVVGLLTPVLTDHFLWTIQQGRILLWGVLGVMIGSGMQAETKAAAAPLPRPIR